MLREIHGYFIDVRAYIILSKLVMLRKLQNPKQMVQEGALTALASVADSSQVY